MKKRKSRIEKNNILNTISSSAGLPAAYLLEKGSIYQPKDPPGIASNGSSLESLSSELLCAASTIPNQE
ncbi:hypothetical protein AYI68_g8361 [Smittium mucronatum]|uniref:Uncharacterized protein n=1 Tax=Smittium mucronatum TaxID=133383 RepID=A0A1R0GL40_9FUNG|nr:hypothetical protein AYI68_g8361 [Smittium mucronatum]